MVFGSAWEGSTTDSEGKPRVVKSGPNAGKPATQWSFGVAFPKVLANGAPNTEWHAFYKMIHDAGRAGYPQFYNGPVDPITGLPGITPGVVFATKIKDGDGFDTKGKPNNQKEGWAGHWVVVFSSQYAPRVFDINVGLDPAQQLQDKSRVLPGDYIAVNGTVEANFGSPTPGVYVNGNMVCFVGAGPRIVSGPKAADAFAGVTAGQLPPGCVPGATPASVAPLPVVPGAVPTPPAVPTAPVVPHDPMAKAAADGWVAHPQAPGYFYKGQDVKTAADVAVLYPAPVAVPTPPAVPTAPVVPQPPAVPVAPVAGPTLTPAALAAGFTSYAQAIANNWTDAMLRQHGYLV
jgi:hypothetical protein